MEDLPDEEVVTVDIAPAWKMYFNGSATRNGAGLKIIFITTEGDVLPYATLTELCSNNIAEYQAMILGLGIATTCEIRTLEVYRDSNLVINQLLTMYEVRKPELLSYHKYATQLASGVASFSIAHIPRGRNTQANALASLASSLTSVNQKINVELHQAWITPPVSEEGFT